MYKISIILPVFNVEKYVEAAFNSIFNQTIGFENLEVIFVDDCSTDNSGEIIQNFVNKFDNVKYFRLDKNSGAAGKPRNIGIENATAEYLMFLDPDDTYMEYACEKLYDLITNENVDVVSGNFVKISGSNTIKNNWRNLKLKEKKIKFISLKENPVLLKFQASVWSKIFKKSFITDNQIRFLENLPAQDLYFVSQCFIKANGILFFDKPIVRYMPRENNGESITSKRDKKTLSGFIEVYLKLYHLLKEYDVNLKWLAAFNLYFWSKIFVLSDLDVDDKLDLLNFASPLYDEVKNSDKLHYKKGYESFYEKVCEKDFYGAICEANKIYLQKNKSVISSIKSKTILMIFVGFEIEIGGLVKSVFNRANMLSKNGYNVILLNIDTFKNDNILENFKNFKYLESFYKKIGVLNSKVNIINMFDYFSKRQTYDFSKKHFSKDFLNISKNLKQIKLLDFELKLNDNFFIYEEYVIERKVTKDNQIILYYYNKDGFKDKIKSIYLFDELIFIKNFSSSENIPIKSETYINHSLTVETFYKEEKVMLYTLDGFNYCTICNSNNELLFTLNDRNSYCSYSMNYKEFYEYFIILMCMECSEKPFLINDCLGKRPSIGNIPSNLAHKISSIHCNHHKNPFSLNSGILPLGAFENIFNSDALVVLTKSQKKDLNQECDFKNIYNIPNFIPNKFLDETYTKKHDFNPNKISVFSRICPLKNISDIIYAFRNVVEQRPDVILEIFGRSLRKHEVKEYEKLIKLVEKLNLKKNVIFRGHVDNVYEEMSTSLFTIFTSKTEGLGLVILESMAYCTPVISYDLQYEPRDIIKDGKNGFLIEERNVDQLSEKMMELLNHPQKAIKMGEIARKDIISNFSEKNILKKWENLFKIIYIDEICENTVSLDMHINSSENVICNNIKINNNLIIKNSLLSEKNRQLNLNLKTLENKVLNFKKKSDMDNKPITIKEHLKNLK